MTDSVNLKGSFEIPNTGTVSHNKVEGNKLLDKKTSEIQEKLTSQDNIEKLSTKKSSGRFGRILSAIAGGLLLAAGLAAAAVATVASMGLATGIIAAVAATVGIAGASITAGVAGTAGIGCIAGSIISSRSAAAFAERQNTDNNTNDNLAMITNGRISDSKAKKNETVLTEDLPVSSEKKDQEMNVKISGLTRSFTADQSSRADLSGIVSSSFYIGKLAECFFEKTGLRNVLDAIDISDKKHPKLLKQNQKLTLKPEYITDYVRNVIQSSMGLNKTYSKENIALVRYALGLCFDQPQKLAAAADKLPALTNGKFVDEITGFIQTEMDKIKDSQDDKDVENYNCLAIFKAALRLSADDIEKLKQEDE